MDNKIINERLKQYKLLTLEDEENALKEILQELALYSLSVAGFFSEALFHGGTSLRILYQLPRFSEDLDFVLKTPNSKFNWGKYTEQLTRVFNLFNIEPEIVDRTKTNTTVQKLFLKDTSIGKIINFQFHHHQQRKLMIKFEIDTNPPFGAKEEIKFLEFPQDYAISAQDLGSNFSGKCHALLCRKYIKGRDWFDFAWYVSRKTPVNFNLLSAAINQNGPWKDKKIHVDAPWLLTQLKNKIETVDWTQASVEVTRFLSPEYQSTLKLWSKNFFLEKVSKMGLSFGINS